jgi:pyruvate/2-oxoglutarate dehydrogenase complex dihydrolipoamide acyltransferase (E2) component
VATEIRIPKIGVSTTEATLTSWHAGDGAVVETGQLLYTLEMEKAVNEIEAPVTGSLRIIGRAGETYEVGTLVATIE